MTISQELFELGNAISGTLKRARDDSLVKPLKSLDEACDTAARAWSGSNIGYHATVYFTGLAPKPADIQFSPEWGLMDRWPTHQPAPGWVIMDNQTVVSDLLARANISDLTKIEHTMTELRESLVTLKEQAVSMLSASLAHQKDTFLSRQLQVIERLKVAMPGTIAVSLLPKGQVWSRDSTAMSQGLAVAPHQTLRAICLSETVTKNGLEALERAVRLSASHLQRIAPMDGSNNTPKANIVISHGHSPAWRDLKDFISDRLRLPYDEFNRVPVAGIPNSIRLTQMLDAAGIAFIILTGEDEQADGSVRARMNVIHEAGLFQGRLGFSKGIVLLEEGCGEFSNIEGLGQIRFPKGNIKAVFEDIRAVLEREEILVP
jgi:predicted nucleotide-binding protein